MPFWSTFLCSSALAAFLCVGKKVAFCESVTSRKESPDFLLLRNISWHLHRRGNNLTKIARNPIVALLRSFEMNVGIYQLPLKSNELELWGDKSQVKPIIPTEVSRSPAALFIRNT